MNRILKHQKNNTMSAHDDIVPPSSSSTYQSFTSGEQRDIFSESPNLNNLNETRLDGPTHNRDEKNREHGGSYLDSPRGNNHEQGNAGSSEVTAPAPDQDETPPRDSDSTERPRRSVPEGDAENGHIKEKPVAPAIGHSVSPLLTRLYTVSYLVFFSILGTLARLGVQWLTFYPGAPVVTPVIWANFGGSLVMGFLSEDQSLFRDEWMVATAPKINDNRVDATTLDKAGKTKRKKTIPLYIGLAVGFCGSFTSFSSFARDFFLALANDLPTPVNHAYDSVSPSPSSTISRNGGYSFMAFVGMVALTMAVSLSGLSMGAHLALALAPYTPKIPINFTRKVTDPIMVVLAFGCWLGAVLLAIWPPDRPSGPSSRGPWANETWRGEVILALVFAPVGCIVRFYLSLKLNALVPSFPMGTFAANMFGTAVEAMCFTLQRVRIGSLGVYGGSMVGCQVLQGVQDGFCGCLTTVSTFVAELNGLRRQKGYFYGFTSVAVALGLTVVIMGSVRWSIGWGEVTCNTGYTTKLHG
ncbi:Hypothetical protein R9X50_00168500 [Acrodontium crateriforme]|uniref:Uncharacterized protein n=1 Tax=Acrodontium crateriforme TaxID=150365 RepID=A0AAQ3M2V9_9PEZI|nr:Hypothetical protein R9X50_00168500 [Acrodontium crateriforme]